MVRVLGKAVGKLKEKRAQILLPAVMLVPIFILVIYLLFETAKVSMSKVRQQFALDNAAYSQMSATSTTTVESISTYSMVACPFWFCMRAAGPLLPIGFIRLPPG